MISSHTCFRYRRTEVMSTFCAFLSCTLDYASFTKTTFFVCASIIQKISRILLAICRKRSSLSRYSRSARKSSLEFCTEVSFVGRDLHGLCGRFSSEPTVQFLSRRVNVTPALFHWHS